MRLYCRLRIATAGGDAYQAAWLALEAAGAESDAAILGADRRRQAVHARRRDPASGHPAGVCRATMMCDDGTHAPVSGSTAKPR